MKNKIFKGLNILKNQINTVATNAANLIDDNLNQNISNIISYLQSNKNKISNNYYSENLKKLNTYYSTSHLDSNPILYIAVVSFHQKKGSIIEFTYPEKDDLLINENIKNYLKSLSVSEGDTPSSIIDNINNQLTYLCLPDGSHSSETDSQFFLIQNFSQILYGISCYRQLQVTNAMKEDDIENTRDCVQKAMCIVSKIPLFGPMSSKLSVTMSAYFNQSSLKDKAIIKELYCNYETGRFKTINVNEILDSFSLRRLISMTKEKIFELMKLILLEGKILVFSHLAHNVCSFIFSFLSIFPCNAFFNLDIEFGGNAKNYFECYKKFGFPIKFFNKNSKLYSLLTLYDVEKVEGKEINSFLIGTTNQLLLNYNKLQYDCIINLDEGKITYNQKLNQNLIKNSKNEKNIFKQISTICQFKKNEKIVSDNWMINNSSENSSTPQLISFEGSDDYLRKIFIEYLTNFLCDIALITHISNELSLDNETKSTQIKKILSNHNSTFIHHWISTTTNFKFWRYEHEEEIWYRSQNISYANNILILYDNGDYYKGEISKGIPNGSGTLIYSKDNMIYTYIGSFINGKKEGKGNLSSKDNLYIYEGNWKEDKKNGQGQLLDHGIQYTGNFVDDIYNGYGCLICKSGDVYEGEFIKGLLYGMGHLNYNNGDIYVGNFEQSFPNGKGQLTYKNGDIYNGDFRNGKKSGKGFLMRKNGEKYDGIFESDLFNGKGIFTKENGEVIKGIWKDGELFEEIDFDENKEEEKSNNEKKEENNEEEQNKKLNEIEDVKSK